jgi:hypothetical protein
MTEQQTLNRDDALAPFRELLGGGGAGGRGNDGGDGGGPKGGGGDDDFGPLGRLLLDALRRMGDKQLELTMRAVDDVFARMSGLVTETAAAATRQDEVVAKTLGEAIARSIDRNADLAEHVANFGERVVALERQVAALKPAAAEKGSAP